MWRKSSWIRGLPFPKAQYRSRSGFGKEDSNSILGTRCWICPRVRHVRMTRWASHPGERSRLETTPSFPEASRSPLNEEKNDTWRRGLFKLVREK